ncbi:NAD-dependent epimerase/dehydratase family protein [Cytophagaceae bacterium DM2B3-1]|uniref:NAD-dependent epimerase/dehydratase family protein n=1 Tax=Xanthocytophaga flava TaxID=3048013 RepID=A0ABT7CWS4_9BACT|nr:NAD-dependent epimerase/dehydratase family protein [Xanthocytophaga flavus]MDJ1497976.1 NAD-dependent epimerase/dehydratase family protein [Xanthocytophaga flavus]
MMNQKIKAIVTGATGMVGEGVLHECLQHPDVESVLVIARKPSGVTHPKLKEIIHTNFLDITPIENQLTGYNACFFCLGVSSVGMKEPEYYKLTYTLTLHVAQILSKANPDMTFCYISGSGTDSTEKGRSMWARVKGKTENDLTKLPFKAVYNFRPGYMQPTKGLKYTLPYYKYVDWLYPFWKFAFPNFVTTLSELGLAMIHVVSRGYHKSVIEVKDILILAKPV